MLSILHIIDSAGWGGAERVVSWEIKYASPGHYHSLLVLNGNIEKTGDSLPQSPHRMNIPFRLVNIRDNLNAMNKFIADINPDIINLNLQASYLFYLFFFHKKFSRVPVNVSIHALPSQIGIHWFVLLAYMRRMVSGYTVEDRIAEKTLKMFGVPQYMIRYIPLGTEYCELEKNDNSVSPYVNLERPIFLNIARMVPGKGHKYLIKAFSEYKKKGGMGTLYLIGYGRLEKKLKKQVSVLNLSGSVVFGGTITGLVPYYRYADVYISSSVDEGMGVVIYDAMASGLPVVGFNAGSISEIVENGVNGMLVENKNTDSLSEMMRLTAENANLRKSMGMEGKKHIVSRYTSSRMATSYAEWFEEIKKESGNV